jgi:hypothetical protein
MSITRSFRGREQQVNRFPAAGGSSGSGSYFTDPEINPHLQVWQTPVRHDQRIPERVVMAMTGHKSWAMFDRYNIASTKDIEAALRKATLPSGKSADQRETR